MDNHLQLRGKTGRTFYVTLNLSAPSKDLMGSIDLTWVHCLMETCPVHSSSNERLQEVRRSYREKYRSGQEELVVSMSSTFHWPLVEARTKPGAFKLKTEPTPLVVVHACTLGYRPLPYYLFTVPLSPLSKMDTDMHIQYVV
jgi:hypothetical protein